MRRLTGLILLLFSGLLLLAEEKPKRRLGEERAVPRHLEDGAEFSLPIEALVAHGRHLFEANWTPQDGGGRPLMKGNGRQLADLSQPLTASRAFNRLSGPDANSCFGCHNVPFHGGGGDYAASVFVLGQRFDFATLDSEDNLPTRGARDEAGKPLNIQTFANLRASTGMFGSGYLEMLARQVTADLQAQRDALRPGQSVDLQSKGIRFGKLSRRRDGTWDTSSVEGLSRLSLLSTTSDMPPSLILRPWHQAGNVISLREFTNNALNQHHGIQSTERFGYDRDADGDGVVNEITRADLTALTAYQATLPAPGRVISRDPEVEAAVWKGEQLFEEIGCARCHIPRLPLTRRGWIYEEPGPFNPPSNLRQGDAPTVRIDLTSWRLPQPRLPVESEPEAVVWVPAYTDFKLHDITTGPEDMNAEPLDMNFGTWAVNFGKGNRKFLTKRLWGAANEPPYFHHGLFTTLREAVLAHSGEALDSRKKFEALSEDGRDSVIEFLKTLQVLPPGTTHLVVDENFQPRPWPPVPATQTSAIRPAALSSQ
jgi:cytochrome c peroxidase